MSRCRDLIVWASMSILSIPSWAGAQTFVVQGSTTFTHRVMEPYQSAIEASSGHKLTVIPNKSSLGLLALFERRCDFAMISGPLENEVERLKRSHPNLPYEQLHSFNVANTRMAFAVNRENPVRALTDDQMRRILLGSISNWRDVGGHDLLIRIVQVREGGGVQASIEDQLLNGNHISVQDPIRVQISSQVVKVVEQLPEALGLSQLSIVANSNTHELTTEHPVVQHLNLITLGPPSREMRRVIDAAHYIASTTFDR